MHFYSVFALIGNGIKREKHFMDGLNTVILLKKSDRSNTARKLVFLALCLVVSAAISACAVAPATAPDEPAPTSLDFSDGSMFDLSDLMQQTQLTSLNLTGSDITIEEYTALQTALPNCDIRWSVPLGGERIDSTATELTLASAESGLPDALGFFPSLETVRLEQTPDATAIAAFGAEYPDVRFLWDVNIGDKTYPGDAQVLDLSGEPADPAVLTSVLPLFPQLQAVTFGSDIFSEADQLALVDAFPSVQFIWNVQLLDDLIVRSDTAELDLRDYEVPDAAAFSERLRLLPALTRLDMCGCGPDDFEMAAMRERYPDIKFIWLTRVSGWIIRTDIKGFSTGNRTRFPDGAGWYTESKFSYKAIKAEDLVNLKYCTDLIALDIGHCTRVKSLDFLRTLPKLQYLDIALCDFTDISALESQPDLIYLQMMYNLVSDISPLQYCKELRFLNLSDNVIADPAPLYALTKLERLWINTTGLSKEQIASLEQAMPDTLIKANQRSPEYAMSVWLKENEAYVTVQALYGLRAKFQPAKD